jgi:hypothetical protein
MIACGEGGASTRLLGPSGLGCGKTFKRGGESSLDLSDLKWRWV